MKRCVQCGAIQPEDKVVLLAGYGWICANEELCLERYYANHDALPPEPVGDFTVAMLGLLAVAFFIIMLILIFT